jgi:hypothetical protein
MQGQSNNVSPVTSSLRPHVLDILVPLSQGSSSQQCPLFFTTKEELYYMIAEYINTLQALWITK